jgi:hypothetical protein
MSVYLNRALCVVAALTVIACVVAYSERHATHGAAETVGAIAWFTFLPGLLALVVLGAAVAVAAIRRRRTVR